MNKDRVKGAIDEVVGSTKRHVGNVTGNTGTQVKGAAQQFKGKVETAVGKGSVLYFASQIDRAVMLDGHSDFTALLANAVCYFIGKDEAVATNAPESLIVTRLSSVSLPGSWMVSFINTTSAPLRPLRSIIPLRDIAATVRVPDNARAAGGTSPFRVTSFGKGGEAVRVRYDGGHVAITIPEVHEFLSLRFDPAP